MPDVKRYTPSIVESIGTKGVARSIEARLNHTLRMPNMHIQKFLDFADKITLPVTLEELRTVAHDKKRKNELQKRCELLEKKYQPSHPFSTYYLDKNQIPLFYYLGDQIADEPRKEYMLTNNHWENFDKQMENRQQIHLASAKREGKMIICNGFEVSFSLFSFSITNIYIHG